MRAADRVAMTGRETSADTLEFDVLEASTCSRSGSVGAWKTHEDFNHMNKQYVTDNQDYIVLEHGKCRSRQPIRVVGGPDDDDDCSCASCHFI
jgi:hypothetical protein